MAPGAALKANGDKAGSLAAYGVSLERVKEMEPEAQEIWGKSVRKAMAQSGEAKKSG